MPTVPPRGDEAVPQGRALLHREVRDREAQHAARPARPPAQGQDGRLRRAAAREAEGQAHLRRARRSVPPLLRAGRAHRAAASPAKRCCSCWSAASTTPSTAWASPTSRAQARQLVRHGHFLVNGKRVDIPSFSLKSGDTVIVREGSRENPTILHAREEVKGRGIPEWISPEGDHGAKVVIDADARADQPARAGTADRRVVQQVRRLKIDVGDLALSRCRSHAPAACQACSERAWTLTAGLEAATGGPLAKGS